LEGTLFLKTMKILTFDVEDWFHILEHESLRGEEVWNSLTSRLDVGVDRILELINGLKATFFCLGWAARKHPDAIKRIAACGHEIACHSDRHILVNRCSPDEFRKDTLCSIKSLEDICGKPIKAYRAPGFSISLTNLGCSRYFMSPVSA